MILKGTKLYSIFTGKCPQCHHESMYETGYTYKFSKIINMNEKCSNCGLKYQIEPSFFFGAMYVNYGVSVAFAVATFVIVKLLLNFSIEQTILAIIIINLIFYPFILRISRNIWINFFVKYKEKSNL